MDIKRQRLKSYLLIGLVGILALASIGIVLSTRRQSNPEWQIKYGHIYDKVKQKGSLSIIVGFKVEGDSKKQAAIDQASSNLIAKLKGQNVTVTADKLFVPLIVLTVDEAAFRFLAQLPEVTSIDENEQHSGRLD